MTFIGNLFLLYLTWEVFNIKYFDTLYDKLSFCNTDVIILPKIERHFLPKDLARSILAYNVCSIQYVQVWKHTDQICA